MYQKTPLKNLITITTGKLDANAMVIGGKYPFFTCAREFYQIDDFAFDGESILVAGNGDLNVKYYNGKFNAYQRTYVLQNFKGVDGKYLYYVIEDNLALLRSGSRGSTIKYIRLGDLQNMQIPLPPLPTQHLIVSEIEKQFSRLDEGLLSLRRAKENLKKYNASVLKSAVEGKLTEDFRKTQKLESASILLEKILEERKKKFLSENPGKKYKKPEEIKQDDLPNIELPEGWVWVNLGQVTWSVKDGPHYSPSYVEKGDGVPFITGGNVRLNGVDFENCKFISYDLHQELKKRCYPEKGDILYTKGGTTGIARVNTYDIDFNVWVHVAVLKLIKYADPFFIQYILTSTFCYDQSQKYTHGVGNQDLGLTRMIKIILPLPPLSEQNEIVKIVESKLSVVEKLEKLVDENIKRSENLKQSILKKAFEGELIREE